MDERRSGSTRRGITRQEPADVLDPYAETNPERPGISKGGDTKMTIEKWSPFKEIETMRREMDKIWVELFPTGRKAEPAWRRPGEDKTTATPAIEIFETKTSVIVKAEMPGVKKEYIEISFLDDALSIKGELKPEEGLTDEDRRYSERDHTSYSRTIGIPFKVQPDRITASLKDGILSVDLPKVAQDEPRKITINVK